MHVYLKREKSNKAINISWVLCKFGALKKTQPFENVYREKHNEFRFAAESEIGVSACNLSRTFNGDQNLCVFNLKHTNRKE